MKKFTILLIFTFIISFTYAQWSVKPGIGIANPVSGYKTITSGGMLLQFDAARRLNNKRWAVGLMLAWAHMHNDNNESDAFGNARLDQIPILATGEYELTDTKLIPYVGMGLGVSLYNLTYDVTATSGESIFNVSFSFMPRVGLRMPVTNKIYPFIEVNWPIVMDGPPQGVSKSDKATGYVGIAVGAAYRF